MLKCTMISTPYMVCYAHFCFNGVAKVLATNWLASCTHGSNEALDVFMKSFDKYKVPVVIMLQ